MDFLKKARSLLALGLAVLLLLPGCAYGIADPIGDLEEGGSFAPFLSVEEADALFGATTSTQFGGPYMYYTADLPGYSGNAGNPTIPTVYRYNCETGEVDFACQDPVCTHKFRSGCPFEDFEAMMGVEAYRDGILYVSRENDLTLCYYDLKTRETMRIFENTGTFWVVGDHVYIMEVTTEQDSDNLEFQPKYDIWRWTPELKTAQWVTGRPRGEYARYDVVLYHGRETVIETSFDGPEGSTLDIERTWLYRIDAETQERELFFEHSFPNSGFWYGGDHLLYWDRTNGEETPEEPTDPDEEEWRTFLYLVDLDTMEEEYLGELHSDLTGECVNMTESCILWLRDDPADEYSRILHCYNFITGEKSEYPMPCAWYGDGFYYYRGRLYMFFGFSLEEALEREAMKETDFEAYHKYEAQLMLSSVIVDWDILTGRQRVIDGTEVFLPEIAERN